MRWLQRALGVLLAAFAAADAAATSAPAHLGPGRGAWRVESPLKHGISPESMQRAAELIRTRAAQRYCLVVVKEGAIIHESYYANTSESVYETDSMAKTFTAALLGVAVQQGLIDIDKPLRSYGVEPHGHWNTTGVDYFHNVTARNLLSMSSGYGVVPPGTRMTYSSGAFTQELSYLLSAASNASGGAIQYASDNFAVPLGIDELYAYDDVGEQISAAGGQMVSCREAARVGQLIANGGKWLDAGGKPYQMADPDYIKQMLQPAVPGVIDGYGLLTWLNKDMTKPAKDGAKRSHCCGPRWKYGAKTDCGNTSDGTSICGSCCSALSGYNLSSVPCDPTIPVIPESETQEDNSYTAADAHTSDPSEYVTGQMVGDSFPDVDRQPSPEGLGVAMGQYAKYLYVLPEENLTVVTMGQSMGRSLDCEAYSDVFTLSLIWRSLRTALDAPNATLAEEYARTLEADGAETVYAAENLGQPRPEGDRTRATIRADAAAYDERLRRQRGQAEEASARGGGSPKGVAVGGCTCSCPPDQGFGKCFNVDQPTLDAAGGKSKALRLESDGFYYCQSVLVDAFSPPGDYCPGLGVPSQCVLGAGSKDESDPCGRYGGGDADVMPNCTAFPGAKELASASCYRGVGGEGWQSGGDCWWTDTPCSFSPFYPP